MRIRAKLIVLTLGVVALLFAAGAVIYAAFFGSINRIGDERSYLIALSSSVEDELVELGRLPYSPVKSGSKAFAESCARTEAAFRDLEKVKLLRSLDAEMGSAFEVIGNLKELNDARLAKLNGELGPLLEGMQGLFYAIDASISLDSVYTYDFRADKRPLLPAARARLGSFMASLQSMQSSLLLSRQTIAEQSSVIDERIAAMRARAFTLAAVAALCVLASAVILAVLLANGIARSIIAMEKSIARLKEGDLSGRSEVRTRDEIGLLAANLNLFLDDLCAALDGIKAISKSNVEAKDRFVLAAEQASESARRIEESSSAISSKVGVFDARIADSAQSVGKIADSMGELKAEIEGQSSMVAESTAAVTQMLSSLQDMSRITEANRGSTESLLRVAERGRSVFEDAFAKIGEIPQHVGSIREMAGIIKGIASRTNLLAMNAAIEAAHAGEAGKGFAVVADEIRGLSEASNKSSSDISRSIEGIVAKIDEAMAANASTAEAFAEIDAKIREASASISGLVSRIGEIQAGSERVLEAMGELKERSTRVRAGSRTVDEGSSEIRRMMEELSGISAEVASRSAEIGSGIGELGSAIASVSELAERVGEGSGRLDAAVSRFATGATGTELEELPAGEAELPDQR